MRTEGAAAHRQAVEQTDGADATAGPAGAGADAAGAGSEADPPPEFEAEASATTRRPRRSLRSLALWGLPILAVIGLATGSVGWYARRTYYVGFSGDRVTLFKGVPGGLLGWEPTIDHQTELTSADLTEADRADLESGHRFANRSDATQFLERLEQASEALAAATTTTTATSVAAVPESPPATEPTR